MVVVRFCYQAIGGVVEDELVLTCTSWRKVGIKWNVWLRSKSEQCYD